MQTPRLDQILLTRFNTATYQQLATLAEQQLSKAALVRLAVSEYLTKAKEPLTA